MEVHDFRRGFQDVFLPALNVALDNPADFAPTRDAVCAHAHEIIDRHRHGWPHNRDPYTLEFTAFMIGAWRVLRAVRTDTEICRLLETALHDGFRWLTGKVRSGLDESADPFALLVSASKEKEAGFYGDGFTFNRPLDSADAYHLEITACWFVAICRAEGAMAIAPAFCAFDAAWFSAVDPVRHHARFTRPSTLAMGADRCRFHFERT